MDANLKIEAILRKLKPKMSVEEAVNVFRDIFTDIWGFDYADEEIPKYELNDFVAQNTGLIKIIAKTSPSSGDSFYIVYVKSWSDTIKYRQRLVKDLLNFTYSLDLEFANFLIVLDYSTYWKLVVPVYRRELENAKLNIYVIDPEEGKFRTLVENLVAVAEELKKFKEHPPAIQIKIIIDEYMQVKPLTEEFFLEYKKYYYKLKGEIKKLYGKKLEEVYRGELPKEIFVERAAKTFAHTFFNRLMFVYFLQKKGWIIRDSKAKKEEVKKNKKRFIRWLWEVYEDNKNGYEFYRDYLRNLFLIVLNRRSSERRFEKRLPELVFDAFMSVPYFNGGLFSHVKEEGIDLDEIITSLPDDLVKEIILGFFEEYNFTVTEETPYEVEVAVDPAMLGKIYESLIAEEEKALEEEERRVSGIFYTPRAEVDFMCRMAIYEYLERNTKVEEEFLRRFVFIPLHEWDEESIPRELVKKLKDIKIVDPAAGSGAFLVGMFHLLGELYEKAGEPLHFEDKRDIIRNNIHGVDIKEWAIRVAKLRLWLALIEKEKILPKQEPILPNLGAKLVVGDSLAPPSIVIRSKRGKEAIEIPTKVWLELIKIAKSWLKSMKIKGFTDLEELDLLEESKANPAVWIAAYKKFAAEYFDGKISKEELDELKLAILDSAIGLSLHEFRDKIKESLKMKLERLRKAIEEETVEKVPFIWELDFIDVILEEEGFDVMIANPPYVRQEKIYPEYYDLAEFELLSRKEQEKLKKDYKEKIIKHMETIIKEKFGYAVKLNKRSDLYVYFFIQGVNLLNPKGTLVFITSNSWLDVDYGTQLQEFFLRFTNLRRIIDYTVRSFEQADVNTVITVLTRKPAKTFNTVGEECVNFVLLKRPFDELIKRKPNGKVDLSIIDNMIDCHDKRKPVEVFGGKVYSYEDADIRVRSVKAVDLARMGGLKIGYKNVLKVEKKKSKLDWWIKRRESEDEVEEEIVYYNIFGEYKGMKWGGILIRAPRIFYVILDKGKDKLVRLGDIAEVKRGFTTGANEFFYLEPIKNPIKWPVCKICGRVHKPEEGLVAVRNKAGWEGYIEEEFLRPVIKSPQESKKISLTAVDLETLVLICLHSKSELKRMKKLHVLNYITWGEQKGYHRKPTCASRPLWHKLEPNNDFEMVIPRTFNTVYLCYLNADGRVNFSDRFYGINSNHGEKYVLVSFLNSTLFALFSESVAKQGLGLGALDLNIREFVEIYVLSKNAISSSQVQQLLQAFERMANREIKSIFEELGLPKPNRDLSNINPDDVSLDKVMPDRRALDKVIFEALGLTEEEQLEVYKAVVELVKQRLAKAKTFSNKKKK